MQTVSGKFTPIAFLLLLAIIFIAIINYHATIRQRPLTWDEVDYVGASRKGVAANYFEKKSLSIVEFVRLSWVKMKKDTAALSKLQSKLPDEGSDPFQLRHFHPPGPTYYWSLFTNDDPNKENANMRFSNLLLALITIVSCIALLLRWYGWKRRYWVPVTACLGVFFLSPVFYASYEAINFHTPHLLACLFFSYALLRYIDQPTNRSIILLALGFAAVLITLEMGWIILFLTVVLFLLFRKRSLLKFRYSGKLLAWTAAFFILVYFGFVTTGGTLKTFFMHGYRIFFKANAEYKDVDSGGRWFNIISENIYLFILLLATIVLIFIHRKKIPTNLLMLYCIGILYLLFMSPFILGTTYVLPGLGIVVMASVMILVCPAVYDTIPKLARLLPFLLIGACLAGYILTVNNTKQKTHDLATSFSTDLQELKSIPDDGISYASDYHVLNYFLGVDKFRKVLFPASGTVFHTRKNYSDQPINNEIENGQVKTMVLLRRFKYPSSYFDYLQSKNYDTISLNNYILVKSK